MTRDEFLGRLGELLACLPAEQVEETKAFYAEAIADRMEDGMSEEEAVAAMGTPGEVAEATLDDLPAVPRAIARTRRRSTALLWVLAIVGSPVWAPLLVAFAAVALSVYVCIWVLAFCVWVIAVALGAVGAAALALAAAGVTVGHVPYVLAMLGCGLAFSGRHSSWARGPGRPPSRLRASRRSGRGRSPRPSGRSRARRTTLPRTSRRRKERVP